MANWRQQYSKQRRILMKIATEQSKNQEVRMFVELLLSLATIIIFAVFAIRPAVTTISALLVEKKAKEELLAKLEQKYENLKTAHALYESERGSIELLETAIPINPEPNAMVRQIEGLAKNADVAIQNIASSDIVLTHQPSGGQPSSAATTANAFIPLTISVSSPNYTNLVDFLRNLEKTRRTLKIESATISLTETAEGRSLMMTVTAQAPYQL